MGSSWDTLILLCATLSKPDVDWIDVGKKEKEEGEEEWDDVEALALEHHRHYNGYNVCHKSKKHNGRLWRGKVPRQSLGRWWTRWSSASATSWSPLRVAGEYLPACLPGSVKVLDWHWPQVLDHPGTWWQEARLLLHPARGLYFGAQGQPGKVRPTIFEQKFLLFYIQWWQCKPEYFSLTEFLQVLVFWALQRILQSGGWSAKTI